MGSLFRCLVGLQVRVMGVYAAAALMTELVEDVQRKPFGVLMPLFLQVRLSCSGL